MFPFLNVFNIVPLDTILLTPINIGSLRPLTNGVYCSTEYHNDSVFWMLLFYQQHLFSIISSKTTFSFEDNITYYKIRFVLSFLNWNDVVNIEWFVLICYSVSVEIFLKELFQTASSTLHSGSSIDCLIRRS